jgi:hypothetical protein
MVPKFIFIIPYKNRENHKHHFEIYMKYILEDIPENNYEMFFIHQLDNRLFNRGAMKNIGFIAMKKKYPNDYKNITFVFNDIDITPYKKNLLNYETTKGIVKHFYGYKFALGGLFSIKGIDFEKCGGFPNFWAWGFEDNSIQKRVIDNNIKIDRSIFYDFLDTRIINILHDPNRTMSKQQEWYAPTDTETFNSITNLKYTIENEFIHVENFNTIRSSSIDTFYQGSASQKAKRDIKYKPVNLDTNINSNLSQNKMSILPSFNMGNNLYNSNSNNNNKFKFNLGIQSKNWSW